MTAPPGPAARSTSNRESHVKMTTGPSSQDQQTVDKLCAAIGKPFVAIRVNQRGDIECDIALPIGITYQGESPSVGFVDKEREAMWQALVKERVTDIPSVYYTKGKGAAVGPAKAAGSNAVVGTGGNYQHTTTYPTLPNSTVSEEDDPVEAAYQDELRDLADKQLADPTFINSVEFRDRIAIAAAMLDSSEGIVRMEVLDLIDAARAAKGEVPISQPSWGGEGYGMWDDEGDMF